MEHKATSANPAIYVDNLPDAIALSETIDKEVLIIFTADWCHHCQRLKNDLKEDPDIIENKIICYIDKDKHKDIIKEYSVKSIPDCIIIKNKVEIARKVGYINKTKFSEWINNAK